MKQKAKAEDSDGGKGDGNEGGGKHKQGKKSSMLDGSKGGGEDQATGLGGADPNETPHERAERMVEAIGDTVQVFVNHTMDSSEIVDDEERARLVTLLRKRLRVEVKEIFRWASSMELRGDQGTTARSEDDYSDDGIDGNGGDGGDGGDDGDDGSGGGGDSGDTGDNLGDANCEAEIQGAHVGSDGKKSGGAASRTVVVIKRKPRGKPSRTAVKRGGRKSKSSTVKLSKKSGGGPAPVVAGKRKAAADTDEGVDDPTDGDYAP